MSFQSHMNLERHKLCCAHSQHLNRPGVGFQFTMQPYKNKHAPELQTNGFQLQSLRKNKVKQTTTQAPLPERLNEGKALDICYLCKQWHDKHGTGGFIFIFNN